MKKVVSTKTFEELPDTITPLDYSAWRGVGVSKAREIFNSKGFPRVKGAGIKQIADKRLVYIHELGLSEEERKEVLKDFTKKLIEGGGEICE